MVTESNHVCVYSCTHRFEPQKEGKKEDWPFVLVSCNSRPYVGRLLRPLSRCKCNYMKWTVSELQTKARMLKLVVCIDYLYHVRMGKFIYVILMTSKLHWPSL